MRADNAQLHAAADALRAEGCDCIVVSLAHALLNEREAQITEAIDTPSMRVIAAAAIAIKAGSVAPTPGVTDALFPGDIPTVNLRSFINTTE